MPASQAIWKSEAFSATIASDTSVALTRELQCLRKKGGAVVSARYCHVNRESGLIVATPFARRMIAIQGRRFDVRARF
jgi:hypothetical protein